MNHDGDMTLDQLRVFCAVVEHGGFRSAADALYRSQSAISIAVRNLEEELGLALFDREAYRPQLTEAGKALHRRALTILEQSADFSSLAEHLARGEEPQIRLAVSGIVPVEPLLQALNRLTIMAPATHIALQIENLSGTMERLNDDDADIALADSFDDPTAYEYVELTRVSMVAVVHPDAPAAGRPSEATLDDVANATLIIVRDTSIHSPRLSKGIVEGTPQWTVNDFMMKRSIIRSGGGWGRLPLHLVETDIREEKLVMLDSSDFQPVDVPIYMVRKRARPIGPVESMLWQQLQSIQWHRQSEV
jgi:DNA-binding transcriptional LysR family regulator